jgi:4-hydroxybenzoate polyprenyltransferase
MSSKFSFLRIRNRILPYAQLARINQQTGTLLLLLPGAWSIAMAAHSLPPPVLPGISLILIPSRYTHFISRIALASNLLIFSAGAFIMRSAGCTINDILDHRIDKKVERTAGRPIASGVISRRQAVVFLALLLSSGLFILTRLNNVSILVGALSVPLVRLVN